MIDSVLLGGRGEGWPAPVGAVIHDRGGIAEGMKPPNFAYHAPRSLAEALQVLAEAGDDAVLLAGGQSLIPLLNLRLASPRDVVDLARVPGLDDIRLDNGFAEVGALVTHHRMEVDPLIAHSVPLARRAAGYVGFRAIRNRGTVGGSVAHADPAAEWPLALLTLDGEVALASARRNPAPFEPMISSGPHTPPRGDPTRPSHRSESAPDSNGTGAFGSFSAELAISPLSRWPSPATSKTERSSKRASGSPGPPTSRCAAHKRNKH